MPKTLYSDEDDTLLNKACRSPARHPAGTHHPQLIVDGTPLGRMVKEQYAASSCDKQ